MFVEKQIAILINLDERLETFELFSILFLPTLVNYIGLLWVVDNIDSANENIGTSIDLVLI